MKSSYICSELYAFDKEKKLSIYIMDHNILKVLRMKYNLYNDFRLLKQAVRMFPLEKNSISLPKNHIKENLLPRKTDFFILRERIFIYYAQYEHKDEECIA